MNYLKKNNVNWFVWLFLVIIWNYGFPDATPLEDVVVAVILSIFFIVIKKIKK
jgi:hypothetical protein|tara:strand:- start:86 stop:244 length:159 start_codon:yes stop_codon:yes gene_type:complete